MFQYNAVKTCLKNLIGWRNHYSNDIAPLNPDLNISNSGEYFNDKLPMIDLSIIKASLPPDRDLNEYLETTKLGAITECLNDIMAKKELGRNVKTLVANQDLYKVPPKRKVIIENKKRFVGFKFFASTAIGVKNIINKVCLSLTHDNSNINLYLYHSNSQEPLLVIPYSTPSKTPTWLNVNIEMATDTIDPNGFFYFGYYQDDLYLEAIGNEDLDYEKGFCGSCGFGMETKRYNDMTRFLTFRPFYVHADDTEADRSFFGDDVVQLTNKTNWGFNINISSYCDLTTFWCENKLLLTEAIRLKNTIKVLETIFYSTQINDLVERQKGEIARRIFGDKETNVITIHKEYERAVERINFNTSGLNKHCLQCDKPSQVSYNMIL